MTIPIPPEVTHILHTLESAGFEAFVVGGCVRDMLRGITPKDWDITTSALPTQVKALFSRTFDTGIDHGTVTVVQNRQPFEVTTYRIDGTYTDARRPDSVAFTTHIEEDLSRRDFTMNAIAYNPTVGFADPFGGRADIERRIIRAVGDPTLRFGEDALRMLRAIRFAATLGYTIEGETLDAIGAQAGNLTKISAERIREEFTRLLCGAFSAAFTLLFDTGLMPYILQGTPYPGDPMLMQSHLHLLAKHEPNPHLPLALFFAPFADLAPLLRAMRYDNKTVQAIALYTKLLPQPIPADRYAIKKTLRQMPPASALACFDNLLTLQEIVGTSNPTHLMDLRTIAHDIHANNECYHIKDLAINGHDLAQLGFPTGKPMGDKLEKLLDTVMRDPAKNRREFLMME